MKETREKDLEEMEKALFERKRQGGECLYLHGPFISFNGVLPGFTGDYASFKGEERLPSPTAHTNMSGKATCAIRPDWRSCRAPWPLSLVSGKRSDLHDVI